MSIKVIIFLYLFYIRAPLLYHFKCNIWHLLCVIPLCLFLWSNVPNVNVTLRRKAASRLPPCSSCLVQRTQVVLRQLYFTWVVLFLIYISIPLHFRKISYIYCPSIYSLYLLWVGCWCLLLLPFGEREGAAWTCLQTITWPPQRAYNCAYLVSLHSSNGQLTITD